MVINTTESKWQVVTDHISNYSKRMEVLKKNMEIEHQYLGDYIAKGQMNWVESCTRKIAEYTQEYEHFRKMQKEMQDLLAFLSEESK